MAIYYAIKSKKEYLQTEGSWNYGPLRTAYLFPTKKKAEKNTNDARKWDRTSAQFEKVVAVRIEDISNAL